MEVEFRFGSTWLWLWKNILIRRVIVSTPFPSFSSSQFSSLPLPLLLPFFNTYPGMLDGDIRVMTVMALGTGASINIGLLALFLVKPADKLRNWLCFGLLVIYPVCMILVEWFALVLSRRRLERRPASFDGKGNHAEGDKSIRDSIAWLAIYG